jgi:single-strand DNA-binding protein
MVQDPQLTEVNDTNVIRFTLAINEYRKSKDGEKNKQVNYLDFEAWDSGATTIGRYCQKGDEIAVICSARQDKWTDKEGNRRSKIKFRVNKFKLFSNNRPREDEDDLVASSSSKEDTPF